MEVHPYRVRPINPYEPQDQMTERYLNTVTPAPSVKGRRGIWSSHFTPLCDVRTVEGNLDRSKRPAFAGKAAGKPIPEDSQIAHDERIRAQCSIFYSIIFTIMLVSV
jgi:hypothetical protein